MATAKKVKQGDPVRVDGQEGTVLLLQEVRGLWESRLQLPGKQIDCAKADLRWAPEGFWYLPNRVGPTIPNRYGPTDRYTADITQHAHWREGRDDLAVIAVETNRRQARGGS